MPSKWMPDILKERAKLIGHAMKSTDIYRWGDYDWHEDLNVRIDKSDFVHYQRSRNWKGAVVFNHVQPVDIKDRKFDDPVKIDSKNIDASELWSSTTSWADSAIFQQEYTARSRRNHVGRGRLHRRLLPLHQELYAGGRRGFVRQEHHRGGSHHVARVVEPQIERQRGEPRGEIHRGGAARPQDALLDNA